MISTILLLPHAETRERLLAPGAPVAVRGYCLRDYGWALGATVRQSVYHSPEYGVCESAKDDKVYLVLARSGAVVPEGADRLARATGLSAAVIERALFLLWARGPVDDVVARTIAPLGTLLLLDAEGNVVTP